ncbi:glutamate--cysteine ligase [Leptospira kirschneri str. 2008720114]|uniref:glutamate--cysteine ligase n=1 Tax=Leptospira kirschneri TaxID=29507 RepID=UPI000278535B|nr:glutamate--cysteine ligase [Leptospira kirschneri]EJO70366.1 glutamate--cysteine ligase [Leptospira kirschneri serovar Grippotyphosa str. RM52]EKP03530.1 glutamate--cysteine ligase [Leptospira kirschneri str. 2008720114]EMK00144.1 glutamate--cysteine ligase [Leptospira kirschneri str. MMD1493]WBF95900.1 glutamate--cysteine ligase [Leptospira kirschneri]
MKTKELTQSKIEEVSLEILLRHAVKAKHGLEKESMRVNPDGTLAGTIHPTHLGSSLTNHYIKTDFAEPQLEYATHPRPKIEANIRELQDLHIFTIRKLQNELIWPFSMPPVLPEEENKIPLGQYGTSHSGRWKTIYRHGLGLRYGRRMQTISGVHYNFSFSKIFLRQFLGKEISNFTKEEISSLYLHVIRNFLRRVHFLTYLTGSSTVFDSTFLPNPGNLKFEKHKSFTLYSTYATSLRMSEIGYTSKVQDTLGIHYNSLEEYVDRMCYAVHTPYPKYVSFSENKDAQLNPNYLQIENEFYSPIRPKQIPKGDERPLDALLQRGIEYIEIRSLDIDPYSPLGVCRSNLAFTQLILLDSLLKDSPSISEEENFVLKENLNSVIWEGRNPELKISVNGSKRNFQEAGAEYSESLRHYAKILDLHTGRRTYQEAIDFQIKKWKNPDKTPSGKLLSEILKRNIEFREKGIELARENKRALSYLEYSPGTLMKMEKETIRSFQEKEELEKQEIQTQYPTVKLCNH